MNCDLEFTGRKRGSFFLHRCKACKKEWPSRQQHPTTKVECSAKPGDSKIRLAPPPLPIAEIERRISICETCPQYLPTRKACQICKTCGSGMAIYQGLLRNPTKQCPWPEPLGGSKWGPPLPEPLKVAFLSPGLNCGGAERWMASLAHHFDPAKIHVSAVVVGDGKHLDAKAWFPKHTAIIPNIDLLPQVLKQVDLLISWGPMSLDSRTKGVSIPVVDVAHGTLGHWGGPNRDGFAVQEGIAKQAIAAGAHLAAVNEECLLNYPEEYRDKVTVIPNGAEVSRVESSLSKEEAKAKFGIPECQKVVLFMGRFAREKNLQAIVDALEFLPGWTLLACGPKYHLPTGLAGKSVVMPGAVDHPGDAYRAADVLCMPSLHEAHSLTLIEGNLAGVPIVSYDYPAMRHLTEKHGALARLVPVRCSAVDLAAAIFAAADADVRAIQRIAEEHYTAQKMCDRWTSYIWSDESGIKANTILCRIRRGASAKDAVFGRLAP